MTPRSAERPDPRPGMPLDRRPGAETFGALVVIPTDVHDRLCHGWDLTRLGQMPSLAVCPGCAHAVRVPLPHLRKL